MNKLPINPKNWKIKKRHSFYLYFTLFATIIVTVSTAVPSLVYGIINAVTEKPIVVPELIIVTISSLVVGIILSFFTGKILLAPIKKLQFSMEEVSNGNFDIQLDEDTSFDEVVDMFHYFNFHFFL